VRSSVRRLAFGTDQDYLHPLDHTVAAFQLPKALAGSHPEDGAVLLEPGRSMWLFTFAGRLPTAASCSSATRRGA
jgi:hypothetical protein